MRTGLRVVFGMMLTGVVSLGTIAQGETCEVTIGGNDAMKFVQADGKTLLTEMTVPASCPKFKVILKHVGKLPAKVMGHNWFLAETAKVPELTKKAAGMAKEGYVLPADQVIAGSKLLIGGKDGDTKEETIEFETKGLAGKDLTYFCTFPAHFAQMHGKLVVK